MLDTGFAEQAKIFEEDLKRSRRITLQDWEGRSWTDKLLDTAADLVSSQL